MSASVVGQAVPRALLDNGVRVEDERRGARVLGQVAQPDERAAARVDEHLEVTERPVGRKDDAPGEPAQLGEDDARCLHRRPQRPHMGE